MEEKGIDGGNEPRRTHLQLTIAHKISQSESGAFKRTLEKEE